MSAVGSGESAATESLSIRLPKELDRARVAAGLADPEPIGPDEAYRIRCTFDLNRKGFSELIGTTERSVYNYEDGKLISVPMLILYNLIKNRIRKEAESLALGDESTRPLAAYTTDELTAEINARVRLLTASVPLPEPPPRQGPGRPRTDREAPDAPKRPRGRPRKES